MSSPNPRVPARAETLSAADAPSKLGHRRDIQGLRAVAVIGVVLFHAGNIAPGGFVGVDVFFVISGFVICRLLWRELDETGTLSFRRFYRRRVRRLLPALAAVLLFVAVGSLFFQNPLGPQQDTAKVGVAASLFSANGALFLLGGGGYFGLPSAFQPLLHTWTLAVEEQFYLLLPLTLLLLARLARGRRVVVAAGMGVLACLSFALSYVTTFGPTSNGGAYQSFAFYSSPTRAWEFCAGCLVALGEPLIARVGHRFSVVVSALGAVGIFATYVVFDDLVPFPGTGALLPVFATVLVIAGGTASTIGLPQLLSTRPLVWIGDLSYGWYLWHWPVLVFTRLMWPNTSRWGLAAVAVASLLPTWLSYRYVENPIRFNPAMTGRRVVRMAAVCVVVPILAFAVLRGVAGHPTGLLADLAAQARPHADVADHCQDNLPGDAHTASACTWSVPDAKGTIYLLGDSNAGHFAEPVTRAGNDQHYNVVLATLSGCPFVDLNDRAATPNPGPCRRFIEQWSSYVATADASLVIVASESVNPLRGADHHLKVPGQAALVSDPVAKAQAWQDALVRTLERLEPRKTPVLLLHTVPQFSTVDLRTCPTIRLMGDPTPCAQTKSRAWENEFRRPARVAEENAAAAVPGTATADFADELCGPTSCSTRRGALWLYRDRAHLSVPGSLLLTPRFASLIAAQARPRASGPGG